jgi:diphthamide synthase (EF-2-diphthine--ammonia ligase)
VILSWSGGKDSSMALAEVCAAGRDSVAALLTTVTAEYDRVSVHGVRRELLRRQADAVGLPLEEAVIPAACTNAMYEEAFRAALMRLESSLPDVRAVAFGDLFLEDVRRYRERQFAALARPLVFPIWGRDTWELARQFITSGYEAILVCVDTKALPASFAAVPSTQRSSTIRRRAWTPVERTVSFTRSLPMAPSSHGPLRLSVEKLSCATTGLRTAISSACQTSEATLSGNASVKRL